MLRLVCEPAFTSCGIKPTLENTSVAFAEGTPMAKLPSAEVVVPVEVPFTFTLTFSMPAPVLSVTFPLTV